jgi:hypothetical protein
VCQLEQAQVAVSATKQAQRHAPHLTGNCPVIARPQTVESSHEWWEHRFGKLARTTALVLNVSPVTVRGDWSSAKIWLYRELSGETDDGLGSLETAR